MTYLHYQYCSSNFVLAEDYRIEYFTKESDSNTSDAYYQVVLRNLTGHRSPKIKYLDGLCRRIFVPKEEIVKYLNGEKRYFTYDPIKDTPEMYLEMNKIEMFNEKSLMKFIKNYGLPFHEQKPKNESGIFRAILLPKNDVEKFVIGMDVIMFYQDLVKFQTVLKIWNYIKADNIVELMKIKEFFERLAQHDEKHHSSYIESLSLEGFARVVFSDLGFNTYISAEVKEVLEEYSNNLDMILKLRKKASELINKWEQVKNLDLRSIAKAYLNLKLKEIKSGETDTKEINGKVVPAIKLNNLLEVAGYQLKQAIFKDQKLEECLNCGALFEPRHAHQKFCSPLPGRKRSTCENTYNQRQKRMRKNMDNNKGGITNGTI